MKYIVTESQLDKIYKKYFDMEFKDSYYTKNITSDDYGNWRGICFMDNGNERMLLGQPIEDNPEKDSWYYDGTYFTPGVIDVEFLDFRNLMKDYVNDRFNLKIRELL